MLIENLGAFKRWLAMSLEPICDADPSALANYVIALVRKDKSENELKTMCLDQLDVFLQEETKYFVDKLFKNLHTKSYLLPEGEDEEDDEDEEEMPEQYDVPAAGTGPVLQLQEVYKYVREVRKKKHPSPQRNRSASTERRTRDKKREDGKWRDYDRHRDKYDWRRTRSPLKSRPTNRSRSRDRESARVRVTEMNKWKNVRDSFRKEISTIQPSGAGAKAKKPYAYTQQLQSLIRSIQQLSDNLASHSATEVSHQRERAAAAVVGHEELEDQAQSGTASSAPTDPIVPPPAQRRGLGRPPAQVPTADADYMAALRMQEGLQREMLSVMQTLTTNQDIYHLFGMQVAKFLRGMPVPAGQEMMERVQQLMSAYPPPNHPHALHHAMDQVRYRQTQRQIHGMVQLPHTYALPPRISNIPIPSGSNNSSMAIFTAPRRY